MDKKRIEFLKAQLEKYNKLLEKAEEKDRVKNIIRMYKEELKELTPGLNEYL